MAAPSDQNEEMNDGSADPQSDNGSGGESDENLFG